MRKILTTMKTPSAEKWAWKSNVITTRPKGKGRTKAEQCNGETSEAYVTPRSSSSSWATVSTPPKSLSSEHKAEQEARHRAGLSDRTLPPTLSPKQKSSIHALPGSPDLDGGAYGSPLDSPSRGDSKPRTLSALSANLRIDVPEVRPRRRTVIVQQLTEKRMAVLGLRMRVQESRNALRNHRETLVDRDAQFLQDLRNLAAKNSNVELRALLSQHEDTQNLRDEVQLKESEYNVFEDELNRHEWEVKGDEIKVYQKLEEADSHFRYDEDGSFSEGGAVYVASSSSTTSVQSTISPSRQQWLSRIGDRDLLLERLQELRIERAYCVEEERIRQKFGLVLDEEARSFLDTFDTQHKSLQEDLAQIEADLSRLQEGVDQQADILYSSSQFDGQIEAKDQSPIGSASETGKSDESDFATEDPLFVRDDEIHPIFSNVATEPNRESISTVSYINEWLLHMLRRSAIEVRRFKTTERLRTLQLDRESLARLVLEWWSKDETVNLFPRARNHTARSVSFTSRARDHDLTNRATHSDSVIVSVDRIAQRLQGSHSLRLDGAASKTISRGSNALHHPYHTTASSF